MFGARDTVGISVVIPVFNEAENLPELNRRLTATLDGMRAPFELIYVDDGSSDATPGILARLAEADPRVRAVRLARNYGQHHALMAGFRHARGKTIVTIDADLQILPEDIPKLVAKLDAGFDIVFGLLQSRKHSLFTRLTSLLAHLLMRHELQLPPGVRFSPFRAMRRRLVDHLVTFHRSPVQLETLIHRCTNSMGAVEVSHAPRYAGETKYRPGRRVSFGLTMLTLTTALPLRVATIAGAVALMVGASLSVATALGAFPATAGHAVVLAAVCVLGGALLAAVGVLGEYVAQVQRGVSQEPQYLIREYFGSADNADTHSQPTMQRARGGA